MMKEHGQQQLTKMVTNQSKKITSNHIPIKYTVQSISQQTVQHIRVPLIILHVIWAREHCYQIMEDWWHSSLSYESCFQLFWRDCVVVLERRPHEVIDSTCQQVFVQGADCHGVMCLSSQGALKKLLLYKYILLCMPCFPVMIMQPHHAFVTKNDSMNPKLTYRY